MNEAFCRGLHKILMNAYSDCSEEEEIKKKFQFLASSSVMKYCFGCYYNRLVREKKITPFNEQQKEYQIELWGIADEFLPDASVEEQYQYVLVVMAVLWLNNN